MFSNAYYAYGIIFFLKIRFILKNKFYDSIKDKLIEKKL